MTKSAFKAPFDQLRRDRVNGGYSTKVSHRGHTIVVRFDAESKAELEELLPAANRFWRSRARWFKAFREYAVEELLPTLNGFLDSGEDDPRQVTATQLRAVLTMPFTVAFRRDDDDGCFELSGGDDDVLQEYCIEASGKLDTGFTDGDVVSLM